MQWRMLAWSLLLGAPLAAARAGDDPAPEKVPAIKASKINGELTEDDPRDKVNKKSPHKVHELVLKKGQGAVIRLVSNDFDSFLRIEDSDGNQLAFNDDEAQGNLNSKLVFTAKKDDTYRIIATIFDGPGPKSKFEGKYTLTIDPVSPALIAFEAIKTEIQQKQQKLAAQYQKAPEEEKAKILEQYYNTIPHYGSKLVALARDNPKDSIAEEALMMILTAPGKGDKFGEVLGQAGELLVKDHLGSKNIGNIAMMLGNSNLPAAGKILRDIMEKSTNEMVQGQAAFGLGKNLRLQSEKAFQKNGKNSELIKQADEALDMASKKLGENKILARQIEDAKFMLNNLTVGLKAPEIEAEDIDGKSFKLSDYKGKVVVLTFWGSWCPPCRAMIPHERELVKRLEKAPFVMLGVNSDKDQEKLKEFMEKENMTWRHFWNGGGTGGPISTAWRVTGWPTIYVLDQNGVIRFREVRGHDMDHAVDTLLKEMETKK